MTKEMFVKLSEELGREPTDDEIADEHAKQINNAMLFRDDLLMGEIKQ